MWLVRKILLLGSFFMFMVLPVRAFTVVIDAGHGGKDYGAIGHVLKLKEKDLNLDVSLRLASKIRTAYPDVNVVLTRSTDVFIALQERANIVNRNNADLFICVHTNSAESRKASGAEVFILGTDKMEKNLDVAMRENAVMKLEADYQTTYQGFDPNSIDSYIMFELMQNQYMDRSLKFATMVQNEFVNTLKRGDRGVRQAAFWVLLKSACPSVLVEMGFVSNKEEEQYLGTDKGKREITDAIFTAFCTYYQSVTGTMEAIVASAQTEQPKNEVSTPEQPAAQPAQTTQPAQPAAEQKETPAVSTAGNYTVQIFSSRRELSENDPEFKGLKGCFYTRRGEWYKYMYGRYQTEQEAQKACDQLQTKFKGCFVVPVPQD